MSRRALFNSGDRMHVLVFGDSKTMVAFRPVLFDSLIGPHVRSVDSAILDHSRFVPVFKSEMGAGSRPTHIVLPEPWDAVQQPSGLGCLTDEAAALANATASVRQFPRDLTLLVFQRNLHSTAEYRGAHNEAEQMLRDRSWYIIKPQIHYTHDQQLPARYKLPSDLPNKLYERERIDRTFVCPHLVSLARQYGFTLSFVPLKRRVGQSALPRAADARRVKTISRAR